MKKILVRTGMSPFTDTPIPEIIAYNRIGGNVGNIVYAYSVYRGLMTDSDVELVPTEYLVSRLDVDRINEEFDSFIIPLADFIREDRVKEMKAMTNLIKKLKIPCHILGVGIRADYEYEKTGIEFREDKVAYNFFKAVLEKSSIIGVRGEITGDYLKKIGFTPEKDYTVIGCPSLFTYGEELRFKETVFSKDAKLAFNNSVKVGENIQKFLVRMTEQFKDFYYYPQLISELKTLYFGMPGRFDMEPPNYPKMIRHPLYNDNKVRFHTNYLSWKRDLEKRDFSIGPRLHGNVMAVHAGLPTIWIMHDARMRELVNYHNLPHIHADEVNEKTDVMELFSKIDYKSLLKGHGERFRHYVDFLDKNGIEHIYKDYGCPTVTPLDQKMKAEGMEDRDFSVSSFLNEDYDEIARRFDAYDELFSRRRLEDLSVEDEIKKGLRAEIGSLKKKKKADEEALKKLTADIKKFDEALHKTEAELKNRTKELKETADKLKKTEAELAEAKHTFTFLVRRKIGKLMKKGKKEG